MTSSTPAISASVDVPVVRDDTELERATLRHVSLRLLPLLFVLYICNFIDRTNVAIAALHMNRDLAFSATVYGLGSGIFFLGYSLCEVPSNLILVRVGARRWIARIMVTWGLIASAMMLVRTPAQFYVVRFLLGVAEAGFFPGIVYYLSLWFPAPERARALSRFMIAIPLAATVGNPVGAWLLKLDGSFALCGWQWLFLLEGIPSVLLGLAVLALLADGPEKAPWLRAAQRMWLVERLARDEAESAAPHDLPPLRALAQSSVWLLALSWLLIDTALYGYTFWAPTIIRDTLHASDVATGVITGAIACLSAAGMLVAGARVDRRGMHCLHAAVGSALAALGYAAAALLPTPPARVAGLALVSLGGMSVLSSIWCLPSMLCRGTAAAAAIALVNSVGNIGGFAGPAFIGWMKDATGGTRGAFLGLAVPALLAAVLYMAQRGRAAFARPVRVSRMLARPGAPNAATAP